LEWIVEQVSWGETTDTGVVPLNILYVCHIYTYIVAVYKYTVAKAENWLLLAQGGGFLETQHSVAIVEL